MNASTVWMNTWVWNGTGTGAAETAVDSTWVWNGAPVQGSCAWHWGATWVWNGEISHGQPAEPPAEPEPTWVWAGGGAGASLRPTAWAPAGGARIGSWAVTA